MASRARVVTKNGRNAPVSPSETPDTLVVPFLKWAGGKRWLAPKLASLIPRALKGKYYEPFLGSGAVFFTLRPQNAVLNDVNEELINTYRVIRDDHEGLTKLLGRYDTKHSKRFYYQIRDSRPRGRVRRAARFLYLNRTCWNGLYRVNRKGHFNVPIGTKTRVMLETDDFAQLSGVLKGATFHAKDFSKVINQARRNDLVFADPPYTVNHNMNGFVKYNEKLFSWKDQVRLHDAALAAAKRGAFIVVSNADHSSIRSLYKESCFSLNTVKRYSKLSGDRKGRKPITELVITTKPRR